MGPGLDIRWQKGPLGRGLDRVGPNGAFVEDLLTAAIARLQFYQATRFRCREYAQAIRNLEEAMLWMRERTRRRESDGTEGTNQGA